MGRSDSGSPFFEYFVQLFERGSAVIDLICFTCRFDIPFRQEPDGSQRVADDDAGLLRFRDALQRLLFGSVKIEQRLVKIKPKIMMHSSSPPVP